MSLRNVPWPSLLHSPARILAVILSLVFATEVGVMLLLPLVVPQVRGGLGEALFDALLLTAVSAPPLWLVISAAKRAEQERLLLARETEALRAQQMATLAQLATGVAHEIRNPLTSIKMLIQVNRDKFAQEGLPTDDLELVEHEIRRMERSVNGLLEYARPEDSELSLLPLQRVLANTVQLIDGRCRAQQVELLVEAPEKGVTILGDAAQLQQLLLNLALNALDAMPQGGRLQLSVLPAGDHVEVRVEDSGSGLDPKIESRLFAPFVTTKPNGVGLGLGICRRIAQAHGGTLTGGNRASGGAIFRLNLPTAAGPSDQRSQPESVQRPRPVSAPITEETCENC